MAANALTRMTGAFSFLRMSRKQAFIWLTAWACWTIASMQFYILPFTLAATAKTLNVEQSKISEANTTSMLSRTIGAAIFGYLADQFGRKIPICIDLVLLCVFTLSSGFVHTYGQLVGVRFLFGIAYGGLYGINMAAVLEAVPNKARGVVAGLTQQGFAAGYLLASGFHLAMDKYNWRALYWLGAGLTVPCLVLRLLAPSYSVTQEVIEEDGEHTLDSRAAVGGNVSFFSKLKFTLVNHWSMLLYALVLTSCYNCLGHGTMDVYPTFLTTQRHLAIKQETWVTVILQIGGITGGAVGGHLSHKISPKWIAAGFALGVAPFLPLWVLPKTWNLLALGSFFMMFCYGASIGNLGNILQQLCPHPGLRAAFGGVAYNLGNAVSSIAPTVITKLGEDFPLADGTPDYARTQLIWAGIIVGLLIIVLLCMPIHRMNANWDLEDPNVGNPDQEKKVEDYSGEKQAADFDDEKGVELTHVERKENGKNDAAIPAV